MTPEIDRSFDSRVGAAPVDEVDRHLIGLLLADGRLPVRHLARALRISDLACRQRLDRLLNCQVVRVVALVDPALLDRPVIAFLTIGVVGDPLAVAEQLARLDDLQWIAATTDLRTVLGQASVAGNQALLDLVNHAIRPIPGVGTVLTDIGLRAYATSFGFGGLLPPGSPRPAPSVPWAGSDGVRRRPDDTDKAILRALQQDGRATLTSLAALTGLSVPAARQRFRRLVEHRLLRIQCIPDPHQVGLPCLGSVRIEVCDDSDRVAASLAQVPNVTYILEVAGRYNLHADVVAGTESELTGTYAAIRALPGVEHASLLPYRRVVKWTARWS